MKTTVQTPTTPDLLHESATVLERIENCGDQGLLWVEDLDRLALSFGLPGLEEDMEPRLHDLLAEASTDLARGIAIGVAMAWLSSFALPLPFPAAH